MSQDVYCTFFFFVVAKETLAKQAKRKLFNMKMADKIAIYLHHGLLCDQQKEWSSALPDDFMGFPKFDIFMMGFILLLTYWLRKYMMTRRHFGFY